MPPGYRFALSRARQIGSYFSVRQLGIRPLAAGARISTMPDSSRPSFFKHQNIDNRDHDYQYFDVQTPVKSLSCEELIPLHTACFPHATTKSLLLMVSMYRLNFLRCKSVCKTLCQALTGFFYSISGQPFCYGKH